MLTTHVPKWVTPWTRERIEERERNRLAELKSRRRELAESAELIEQRRANVESADEEIAAVEELHRETLAMLQERRSDCLRQVSESEDAERLLLATISD